MKKISAYISNQQGALPVLFLVAVLGLLSFMAVASSFPLKDNIYSALFPKAASNASEMGNDTSYELGVLVLKYFPLTPDGKNIDIKVTGDVGDSYDFIRQRTIDGTTDLAKSISKASTYLGYKDSNAKPALTYKIVQDKEYTVGVPIQPGSTNKPDLNKIMTDHNICDLVDKQNVREVWMWAYQGPGPNLWISESQLTGPNVQFANGPYYQAPVCQNSYRIYSFNYNSGATNALHSWGHEMEFEMQVVNKTFFANNFQGLGAPQTDGTVGRCGSVHNPPNARSQYDYANTTPQKSDCLSWTADGIGSLTDISCTTWGCDGATDMDNPQIKYLIWNWQNLPGRLNTKTYQGQPIRNLWDIHGDFDRVLTRNRTVNLVTTETPTDVAGTNIAVGKPVFSSSTIFANGWAKENINDGKTTSTPDSMGWTSDSNLGVNHTEWVTIDLQNQKMIDQIKLYPRQDNPGKFFPIDFTIQVSNDNQNFTPIVQKQNYPNPQSQVQSFSFAPVSARFIKLEATKLTMDEGTSFRVQLAELEIYQVKDIEIPSPPPTHVPTPTPTPASKVTIISPNGGETLKVGDKVTIKWSAASDRTAYFLDWSTGPGSANQIGYIGNGATTSYDWIVNVGNLPAGSSRQVKVVISSYPSGFNTTDESDNFITVVAPTPTPTPIPTPVTKTFQINSAFDNINEQNGKIDPMYSPGNKELWFGKSTIDQSLTGLRFNNISIPKNAKIKSAKLEVYPFKEQWITINFLMTGDKVASSAAYTTTSLPSSRTKTTSQLLHSSNVKWPANTWQELKSWDNKDFTGIVQELVNQQNWQSGNSIGINFQGYGNNYARKFVNSYSKDPNFAPKLTITYE